MSEPTDAWRPAAYRVQGVLPGQVVAPDTRESAAECIRRAGEQDWAVVPFGGGTCIEFGFPPARMELVLTTERLNRVVDYQPDDMTVTVDAGLTLAALQRLLAER
ncbi:MAG: FAD-binding oxidoreductase, partial [Armatimonadetes bacterium]|nr:FAD-binding oxidoreductase [Armatimonadota bacterium]